MATVALKRSLVDLYYMFERAKLIVHAAKRLLILSTGIMALLGVDASEQESELGTFLIIPKLCKK